MTTTFVRSRKLGRDELLYPTLLQTADSNGRQWLPLGGGTLAICEAAGLASSTMQERATTPSGGHWWGTTGVLVVSTVSAHHSTGYLHSALTGTLSVLRTMCTYVLVHSLSSIGAFNCVCMWRMSAATNQGSGAALEAPPQMVSCAITPWHYLEIGDHSRSRFLFCSLPTVLVLSAQRVAFLPQI